MKNNHLKKDINISIKKFDWNVAATIFGLSIGVFGIVLSIYFYIVSVRNREPIYYIDPIKTVIIDKATIESTPIRVLLTKNYNSKRYSFIKDDIRSFRLYFWNDGKESIKKENILKKLQLIFPSSSYVIDYKILKQTRELINASITHDPKNIIRTLTINFDILEQNDGFTLQIIYGGNPEPELQFEGVIENSKITNATERKTKVLLVSMLKTIIGMAILVIIMVVLAAIVITPYYYIVAKLVNSNSRYKKIFEYYVPNYGTVIFMIALFLYFIYFFSATITENDTRQMIPEFFLSGKKSNGG